LAETNHDPAVAGKNLEIVVMVKNSRKIFPKLKPNIQIGGIIFQIYRPISRKILHLLTLFCILTPVTSCTNDVEKK